MAAKRVADKRMGVEFRTRISHTKRAHLFSETFPATAVQCSRLTFNLMQPQWLSLRDWWLNYICTGERIYLKIEKFGVVCARLGVFSVPSHPPNYLLV